MKDEIVKWTKMSGLDLITKPAEDALKKALELYDVGAEKLTMQDLDVMILALSNYLIYINLEIGKLTANANYLEDALTKQCTPLSSNYTARHFAERRAIALQKNPSLKEIDEQLIREKFKLDTIKPVADAIRTKVDSLRRVYDRKARERFNG